VSVEHPAKGLAAVRRRVTRFLGETGRCLGRTAARLGRWLRGAPAPIPAGIPAPIAARLRKPGRFLDGVYGNAAGSRNYKLYVPGSHGERPLPLVVMLHGCTQSPDDFAAGTGMNEQAEQSDCLVLYPAQAASANLSRCWNWFSPSDQQRDRGEPSLIAGMTRQVLADYGGDPRRVYIAGLSAGGAAAAIMGIAYPDLYAAIGVHSGLACGAASGVLSAFTAMRHGEPLMVRAVGARESDAGRREIMPTIVFHGDRDTTVHPLNGDRVIAQSKATASVVLDTRTHSGQVPDGHAWSRVVHTDPGGRVVLEQWIIHGAGHAWSGGCPKGSYIDPLGPNATREMLRFFLDHVHPGEPGSPLR
jgi:poly(hydroxyalkanoate) depolymerase family esterase